MARIEILRRTLVTVDQGQMVDISDPTEVEALIRCKLGKLVEGLPRVETPKKEYPSGRGHKPKQQYSESPLSEVDEGK